MNGNSFFGRARTMMAAISAILAVSTGFSVQQKIAALGEYRSRGKGMGKTTYSRKGKRHSTNAAHPGNGPQECARRVRQQFARTKKAERKYYGGSQWAAGQRSDGAATGSILSLVGSL